MGHTFKQQAHTEVMMSLPQSQRFLAASYIPTYWNSDLTETKYCYRMYEIV